MNRSHYINQTIKETGTSFQSSYRGKNKLEMFVISYTDILYTAWDFKNQLQVQLLMCTNTYDDVTDLDVCAFLKNIRILIS